MSYIPEITTELRKGAIEVPKVIAQASGIRVFGKLIKSLAFTTDIATINNIDADAIIAVYPFTPHPSITRAITDVATMPVFCGVGGGITQGERSANVALHAEFQGVVAVVMNAPTPEETIRLVTDTIDIPVVITIVSLDMDIKSRIDAGASIVNVSGGKDTAKIVAQIRKDFPLLPIIATGGPTDENILETIKAGANAITYTPPCNSEIFRKKMEIYRKEYSKDNKIE